MDTARKNLENIEVNFENVRPARHRIDGQAGLKDFLAGELKSLYYVEKTLLKSFPKLIKNSCSLELIEAITLHHEKTRYQVIRLEDCFVKLAEEPQLLRCMAVESMLDAIDLNIEDSKFGTVRDAGIVLGLQQIEQYEIASYSVLAAYSENLGEFAIAAFLSETLNEEKVAQLRLAKIADTIRYYNPKNSF